MKLKNLNDKSILVIGANSSYRDNLSSRLRSNGMNVEQAGGGFHGLNMLEDKDNSFDALIIVDDISDTSGREAMSHIRTLFSKKELPILFIGEAENKDEVLEIFEWGASTFTLRESNFSVILEKLSNLFKKSA